jgi:hypothetical protein
MTVDQQEPAGDEQSKVDKWVAIIAFAIVSRWSVAVAGSNMLDGGYEWS